MHNIDLRNTLYEIIDFLIAKNKAMLFLAEPINEKNSLYTNNFDKKNLPGINKKMLDRSESAKLPKIKLKPSKNQYTTFIYSNLDI